MLGYLKPVWGFFSWSGGVIKCGLFLGKPMRRAVLWECDAATLIEFDGTVVVSLAKVSNLRKARQTFYSLRMVTSWPLRVNGRSMTSVAAEKVLTEPALKISVASLGARAIASSVSS